MQDFLAKTESSALRIAIYVAFGTKFQYLQKFFMSFHLKFMMNLTYGGFPQKMYLVNFYLIF